jgi:predicted lipoprotein
MRPLIALAALLAFLGFSATIVKNGPAAIQADANAIQIFFSADTFDAEGYVKSIWESRVIPYVRERAVDILALRAALRENGKEARERYGYRAVAEHNPYNFAIKGRIRILSANVKSKNGRIEADAFPYDGIPDVAVQIGPIFKGTSLRDLLNFVSFDDFKNQVEFAKLANQLNLRVRDGVTAPLGFPGDGGVGREFDLTGAATEEQGETRFTVIPVVLEPVAE